MWRPGDEPVPGYRLERFLGRGNFGEVWRAHAPGGTTAALKFLDLSGKNGLREFRGIKRVKGIKHANLMPITAIWMLDQDGNLLGDDLLAQFGSGKDSAGETHGHAWDTLAVGRSSAGRADSAPACLVVAMLDGDKNLCERLDECRQEGLPGIPVDELLGYMEEAAKGLDRLNLFEHDLGEGPTRIQHCDIKPANMMLVGGAVLICDFGLAQVMGDSGVTQSITGSPAFMAPECFEREGGSTRRDQYALAVSYCELRTGSLPFDDQTYAGVREAHQKGRLNLTGLLPAEQVVIRRATALQPADRYPSSTAMVQALRQAVHPEPQTAEPARRSLAMGLGALAAVVLLAAAGIWWWGSLPRRVELTLDPADSQLRIDGRLQPAQGGKVLLQLGSQASVNVQLSHPSGRYEHWERALTWNDLQRLQGSLSLRRLDELRFEPADAAVLVDGVRRQLQDGVLRLLLDSNRPVRIAASSKEMYQDLDRLFSKEELSQLGFRIQLQPNAQHHAREAFRLYAQGDFAAACRAFAQALDLGYDSAAPPIDLAQRAAGPIRLARISPTGRWLATAGRNTPSVQVWDLEGEMLATQPVVLQVPDGLVNCIEFCQDGRLLAAGQDASVRLWDPRASVSTGQGREIGRHAGDIVSLAMGPEDQWVASADFGGVIQLWSLDGGGTGQPLSIQHQPEIREIQSDRGGRWLVAASHQGSLHRWDLKDSAPESTVRQLSGDDEEIKCGVFDLAGQQYIAGASGGALRIWRMEAEPGQGDRTRSAHSDDIECLAISPDGKWLVTGGLDGEARIWDMADLLEGEPRVLLGHKDLVSAVAVDARSRWVATGSWDKSVRVWDLAASSPTAGCTVLEGLADRVHGVAISADGHWLAAVGAEGKSLLWDLRRVLLAQAAQTTTAAAAK